MAVWNEASAEKGKYSHEVDKSTCCCSGPGITALRQTSLHNACSRCCSPASNPLLQMCPVVGSTPGCLVDRSKENPKIDFLWGNVFQLIMLTPNIPSIKSPKHIWFFFIITTFLRISHLYWLYILLMYLNNVYISSMDFELLAFIFYRVSPTLSRWEVKLPSVFCHYSSFIYLLFSLLSSKIKSF